MIARWCIVLLIFVSAAAHAAEPVFEDIAWPRHNKDTGMLEWELRARTAQPTIAASEYQCTSLELHTYKLAREGGRDVSKKDVYLRADKGTYVHGTDKATAKLVGHVIVELYETEEVRMITDEANIEWNSDAAKRTKMNRITSQSRVSMESQTRNLSGEGFEIFEQSVGKEPAKSQLRLERNVLMIIRGAAMATPFVAMPGSKGQNPGPNAAPIPITISCLGPFIFDRAKNIMSFHNNVALVSGATTMKCRKLTVCFKEVETGGKKKQELTSIVSEGNVAVASADQHFAGDRFDWEPLKALGKLAGTPARMNGPGTAATAQLIEFDQKTGLTKFTGQAEVLMDVKSK